MRHSNKCDGRYRLQARHFSTEAHFLRFAEARDEDDLTNPVLGTSNFPTYTTWTEAEASSNPVEYREITKAKGASA